MSVPGAARHAWERGAANWDAYYAIVLVATLTLVQIEGPTSARDRLLASAALVAMAAWYWFVGRGAIHDDQENAWRGTIYLIGLGVLLVAAQSLTLASSYALFALCPQCFMAVPFRRAVVAVVAINLTALAVVLSQHPDRAEIVTALGIAVVGIGFSVAFGGWVNGIVRQSRDRAQLIEQLESTRSELAEANREAGMLAERQRLAGEIHDTIAQAFTSIVMLIQAADAELASDPDQARRHLSLAAGTARENLAEVRALVAGLGPAQLSVGSLDAALGRLADQTAAELGISAGLEVCGSPRPLPTGAEVVLLRVCQEALANVRRHARAQQAWVRLIYGDGCVRLEVRDDGAGFDPALVNGGYGLRGMRARAGEVGGSLAVTSSAGAGTTVRVEVPA